MIEVRNLSKRYVSAAQPALHNVSFRVEPGAFLVVLGRSGSGKTTLFRCLNRLLLADSGEILLCGQSLTRTRARALRNMRRNVATIFQQFNLVRRLTALENVLSARLPYIPLWRVASRHFPDREQRWALHCLDRVGLLDLADRRADTLSGGQQQRVAIARALAQQPLVILADEPIASLDTEAATLVLDELSTIARQEGITILCSLHQEEFALRYATHIIGLCEGQVVVDVPRAKFGPAERARIYNTIAPMPQRIVH
jgi:phosphonate transport system ATP-binding protein